MECHDFCNDPLLTDRRTKVYNHQNRHKARFKSITSHKVLERLLVNYTAHGLPHKSGESVKSSDFLGFWAGKCYI